MKMTAEEGIDEKLAKWNQIFDELALDAGDLIRDIRDMINYVFFSAMLLTLMGVSAVAIAVGRQLEPKYLAMSVIVFSVMAGNASLLVGKWLKLRARYNNLSGLEKKLDSG